MQQFFTKFKGEAIGYTGGEAVMRFTPTGKQVTTLPVAMGGNKGWPATWADLVFWGDDAEVVQREFAVKGIGVIAEGNKVSVNAYIDKNGKAQGRLRLEWINRLVKFAKGKETEIELPSLKASLKAFEDNGKTQVPDKEAVPV